MLIGKIHTYVNITTKVRPVACKKDEKKEDKLYENEEKLYEAGSF